MKLGYVVLHYMFSDITEACLQNIQLHDPGASVLTVDNGSPIPYAPGLPTLRLPENVSLADAMNAGTRALFQETQVDVTFQLNNDIRITGSTSSELAWMFQTFPRVGIASPMMNQADADFAYFACPFKPSEQAEQYLAERLPRHRKVTMPFVDNAAFAIRRATWEQVGPLEQRFTGASWGANYDYCWRARALGWEVALVKSAFVFHEHRSTWKQLDPSYFENSVRKMMAEAEEVWGEKARLVLWRDPSWRKEFLKSE